MILVKGLHLIFGQKTIFDDISFTIQAKQKVGLVGKNGAGKSTLLRVLSGEIKPDAGTISFERGKTIGYLPQEVTLESEKSVLDEALSVFGGIDSLQVEFNALTDAIEAGTESMADHAVQDRFNFLQERLLEQDIDSCRLEAKKVLTGLGFKQEQIAKPVNELSLGWRMRLVLTKLLLQKADFYFFDEPTNHLDIVAKDWFVSFLQQAQFGYLLVSHDKFFLDHVCPIIFELDRGQGKFYYGNYTFYLEQKEQDRVVQQQAYEDQQRMIAQKMEVINRFKAKASKASMAQSMLKALEKIERIEPPHDSASMKISLQEVVRAGNVVLTAENLSKTFGEKKIFSHASLEVCRGDKAALVAANGVGKSTLLNLVTGLYPLETGSVKFGHQVTFAFFEQDQGKVLNPKKSIIDEVEAACRTSAARAKVRGLLGSFLFSGDDVHKKNGVLSGGEKNRVAMVKTLLQGANFLILDEPTNHLDLESKEILLKALQQYSGTVLFVSHDRDFLDRLATKIFELTPDGVITYSGDYESYLYAKKQKEAALAVGPTQKQPSVEQKQQQTAPARPQAPVGQQQKKKLDGKELHELARNLERLVRKIGNLEAEQASCFERYAEFEYGSPEYKNNEKRADQIKHDLKAAQDEWEKLEALRSEQEAA